MGITQSKHGDIPGLALIIHNDEFSSWSNMTNRIGNIQDLRSVQNTLNNLAFNYEELANESADTIKAKINNVCTDAKYSKYNCLVVVVMTHGSYDGTLHAYGSHYNTSDIWTPLATSRNFANKPKLLFFQACRGNEKEGMSGINNTVIVHESKRMLLLPHDPHFFIAFSTVENTRSIRNLDHGSWFIQTLCNIIDGYVIDEEIDLNSVITKVTYDNVYLNKGDTVQTPSIISFLPYNITFALKNKSIAESPSPSLTSSGRTNSGDGGHTSSLPDLQSNIEFDGYLNNNTMNFIQHPSHYKRRRPKAGTCLVFHDDLHENTAQRMRQLFIDMTYDTEVIPISGNNIVAKLQEAAENFSTLDEDQTPDSIAVVILATLSTPDERYEDSHVAGDTCISDTWSIFIASRCKALLGRPKLFFYLDSRNVKDGDSPHAGSSSVTTNSRFNDHQDFYWIFGYGQEFISCLENNLRSGYQHLDYHAIVTQATREARDMLQNKNTVQHPSKKLPYRKFTTSLKLIIGDKNNDHNQSNVRQQAFDAQEGTSTTDEGLRLPDTLKNVSRNTPSYARKNLLLHVAVKKGDLEAVKKILEEDVDVNAKNKNGQSAIYIAIKNKQFDILKYLIKKGKPDVNIRLNNDETLLQRACLFGNMKILSILLENGAEVNAKNANGDTALITASANGKINVLALLVKYGADVHHCNFDGTTALHRACELGTYDSVEYLIDVQSVDVNFQGGKKGLTPLHLAVRNINGMKKVGLLLDSGANINLKSNDGTNVFQYAIEYRTDIEILEYLLKYGADVYNIRSDGANALHIAAQLGKTEYVKWLVQYKCDTELRMVGGKTPLLLAIEYGHLDCFMFLLQNSKIHESPLGLNFDSMLHLAVKSGNLEICKYLVELGANINVINSKGWTPLHKAAEKGYVDIVLWLFLKLGASIEVQNNDGETALHVAQRFGQTRIVEIFNLQNIVFSFSFKDVPSKMCVRGQINMGPGRIYSFEIVGVNPESDPNI